MIRHNYSLGYCFGLEDKAELIDFYVQNPKSQIPDKKPEEKTEIPNILKKIEPVDAGELGNSSSNPLENLKKMLLEKYDLSDTEDNQRQIGLKLLQNASQMEMQSSHGP